MKATSRSVFVTGSEVAKRLACRSRGAKVAVREASVTWAAKRSPVRQRRRSRVVTIQDHSATLFNANGIDLAALRPNTRPSTNQIRRFPRRQRRDRKRSVLVG